MLERLEPGTWIFVDHPAFDVPEEIVARGGIELIGYKDLVGD